MATKYSQIPAGSMFKAGGASYRKVDELYYEDPATQFESVWSPMFDNSIELTGVQTAEQQGEMNRKDKYLVDPVSRVMKLNPNYEGESAEASMKQLANLIGLPEVASSYPQIVLVLTKIYEIYKRDNA